MPLNDLLATIRDKLYHNIPEDQIISDIRTYAESHGHPNLPEERLKSLIFFAATSHDLVPAPQIADAVAQDPEPDPEPGTCPDPAGGVGAATLVPDTPDLDENARRRVADPAWQDAISRGEFDTKMFDWSEFGVANRLHSLVYRTIIHVNEFRPPWFCWNGKYWEKGEHHLMRIYARMMDDLEEEAENMEDNFKEARLKAVRKYRTHAKAQAVLNILKNYPDITRETADLDISPALLNLPNGTYDLHDDRLAPHYGYDYITRMAETPFCSTAGCPHFMRFLEEVLPDPDVRGFLQQYMGYCLTGRIDIHSILFLVGKGANGKSVFLSVMRHIFGPYAKYANPDILLEGSNNSSKDFQKAELKGARLVLCEELAEDARMNEAVLKALTAGAPRKCAFKFKDYFEYVPTDHWVVATNYLPTIRGMDAAIRRRVLIVPFSVTIPEGRRDPQLTDRLNAEAPGILQWLIQGYRVFKANGGLIIPDAVTEAVEDYKIESDPLNWFFEAYIEMVPNNPEAVVSIADLYAYYVQCGEDAGIPKKGLLNMRSFSRSVFARPEVGKGRNGKMRFFRGIKKTFNLAPQQRYIH